MGLADRKPPTPQEYDAYRERFSNWGRWGSDDELGTLNFITPERRRAAAAEVTEGLSISLSRPLDTRASPANPYPAHHFVAVGESGGMLDKYIGDAIMVFFGDPVSRGHQEDAVACLSMALEMRAALGDIRARWQKRGLSLPLDVRMGVHTGVCTVGNFGSRDRLDYTTVGNNVNLASRLETSAEANQILISHDTYLLVREEIRCRELGEIEVKNMKHPIQTYEALGHGSEAELLDAALEGFRVYVDPSHGGDVAAKRAVLERALALLEDPQ